MALAQQHLELIEARAHVLRNALERHYDDLCRFATELKSVFYVPTSCKSAPTGLSHYDQQNPLLSALREHLPRSPLWRHIASWDEAGQTYRISVQVLAERIRREVIAGGFGEAAARPDITQLCEAVEDDFGYHIMAVLRGEKGLVDPRDSQAGIKFRRTELLGLPQEKQARLGSLLIEAREWDEFKAFAQAVKRLEQAKKEIGLEADTLALRRVVAGRCRYCPF